jgi:hypothetical protein
MVSICVLDGGTELLLVERTLPYVVRKDVGTLMQEEAPSWFDRLLRAIESSALFVWFMLRCFRGLKVHRWVEDGIRAHYPDKDVQILDCDVCTGRATICVEMGSM